jgi:hypothetical protein
MKRQRFGEGVSDEGRGGRGRFGTGRRDDGYDGYERAPHGWDRRRDDERYGYDDRYEDERYGYGYRDRSPPRREYYYRGYRDRRDDWNDEPPPREYYRGRSPPRYRDEEAYHRGGERDRYDGYRDRERKRSPSRERRRSPPPPPCETPATSRAPPDPRPAAADWDCAHCGAFNFSRRTACFQCFSEDDAGKLRRETGRDASSGAVHGQATRVVFLKNIPLDAMEEEIANKIGTILDKSQIRSIQIPTEKTTGRRKGFAFVDCSSIENATLVKDALNGATLRDDWSHGALSVNYSFSARSQKQSTVNSTATNAILQATAASAMTKSDGARDSDYVYDEATGYYRHKTTGVLYDANTGLFFNAATKSWYSWNEKTQEYTIVGSNAKSDRDTERNANAAETKDKRPVVATVSSAPTTTTTTTTKSPATTDVADVHGVSLTIPQYRDRAKERRKLHGENALDRLVASAADGTQSAVQGRVTGGKIRAQRKRP